MVSAATVSHRVLESQVDWITATKPSSLESDHLLNLGDYVKSLESKDDPTIREWRWRGYEGWRGLHFAYGRRWDSDLLQLSSDRADEHFRGVYSRAPKCTRLDLAVTVQYPTDPNIRIWQVYNDGCRWNRAHHKRAERAYVTNGGGGATTYIGTRASDLYGRIYDKWAESRESRYKFCLRWEVEFKGEVAHRVFSRLGTSANRASDIQDIVSTYFTRRGATAEWMDNRAEVRVKTSRPTSGTTSRLAWLESSVQPVVKRLIPLVDEATLYTALGIDPASIERFRFKFASDFDGHTIAGEDDF